MNQPRYLVYFWLDHRYRTVRYHFVSYTNSVNDLVSSVHHLCIVLYMVLFIRSLYFLSQMMMDAFGLQHLFCFLITIFIIIIAIVASKICDGLGIGTLLYIYYIYALIIVP